jgi:beta-lactam-binding protein with PASTA domain
VWRIALAAVVIAVSLYVAPSAGSASVPKPPDVSGLTVREAKHRLNATGLKFDRFAIGDRWNTYRFMLPIVGATAPNHWRVCWPRWDSEFEILDLWVAPACVIQVPRLVGRRLREVEATLYALGLGHLDKTVDPRYVLDVDIGREWVVCQQHPRSGSRTALRRIFHLARLELARAGHCP